MLSVTSEYALRAMIHVTQHPDECPIPGRRIAEETGVPVKYLSNILSDLVRAGCLKSTPGRSGGFRLARRPEDIMLIDVLERFEPVDRGGGWFGADDASGARSRAQARWHQVCQAERRFLEETSLRDVAMRPRRRRDHADDRG